MAAPVLANRSVAFVNKTGTDDAGYNVVGKPNSFLTIAAALADLAANYPAASLTNQHVVSVGPGSFTTPAFALPPFTYIQGSADGESGETTILLMTGNITLAAAWSVNATKRGGFQNLTIRASEGTEDMDLTMPAPAAGNPVRVVELENIRTDFDIIAWVATSTADALTLQRVVHDGSNSNDFDLAGGTIFINNCQSAAIVTVSDSTILGTVQIYGLFITNASSRLICDSTAAVGCNVRLGGCDLRALTIAETAPGVIAVSADAISIPLASAITFSGSAANVDLTRTTDGGGLANLNAPVTAYGTGTLYSFTNTAAAINFGTTDPDLVINQAGNWLIFGQVNLAYAGATVAAETATIKVRRTNNTPADVGAVVVLDLPVATTLTHTYGIFQIPPFVYTTTGTTDALALFGNVSAALGAGTIDATAIGTSLVAIRIN